VHCRHPCELGGAYYLLTTIMNQLSVFVAAFIYWHYYIPPTTDIHRGVVSATGTNSSASNLSVANLTNTSIADIISSTANYTLASSTGVGSTASKIDPITLVASVGTLFGVWAFAALGVWLTMKPEYRRTFWSTKTGYAYSQSYFLDNEGSDGKRIGIFSMNERHWRAIRDRVKQWVIAMYAVWQALKPLWFTNAVKAQIPDAFIPTEALRRENARARQASGTQASGRLRSLSFALGAESDADRTSVIAVPSPQPINGEEGDGAVQPNPQPGRAEPAAAAGATTTPRDASGFARGGMAVDVESDGE
jgi:hypothetical protein